MNNKAPKKRNRLEGQVARASQLGTMPAAFLATAGGLEDSGRAVTRWIVRYYVAAEANCKNDEALQPHFRRAQRSIAKYFLKAIQNRNVESIRCIADEIEECRKDPNLIGELYLPALIEKYRIEKTGDKVTVNQLKDYWSTTVAKCSYEQAKYICRRLEIPTVRDKIGRKKIRENKAQKKA